MPLPQLPLDVWFRISSNLDPSSLSALSDVSRALHEVATHESHFRPYLPRPHTGTVHPAQEYRRLRALYHPPGRYVSFKLPPSTRVLGSVQDSLLLINPSNSALIIFPSGINVSLKPDLGELALPFHWLPSLFNSFVVLPENRVAFINFRAPTKLTLLDVSTGDVNTHTLPGNGAQPGNGALPYSDICNNNLIAAGNNAEWLMYRSDEDKLVLFNWRTGTVDREIIVSSNSWKYVMGECPATNSVTVVGTLSEQTSSSRNDVLVHGFDGVDTSFPKVPDTQVLAVLRSYDQKTHILLSAPNDNRRNKYEDTSFYARQEHNNGMKEWHGTLHLRSCPELKENGRFIQARQDSCSLEDDQCQLNYGETLWMDLKVDGTVEEISIPSDTAPKVCWIRRTQNGGLVVVRGSNFHLAALEPEDFILFGIHLIELTTWSEEVGREARVLKSWKCTGARQFCVVADHFLLGLYENSELFVYHCDRFCRGGTGHYACPEFDEPQFLERTAHLGIDKGESGRNEYDDLKLDESSDSNESSDDENVDVQRLSTESLTDWENDDGFAAQE